MSADPATVAAVAECAFLWGLAGGAILSLVVRTIAARRGCSFRAAAVERVSAYTEPRP